MVKWFLRYKWLELKELINDNIIVITGASYILVTMTIGYFVGKHYNNDAIIAVGPIAGFLFILFCIFAKSITIIIKNNIEKAKIAKDMESQSCPACGSKNIKIVLKASWVIPHIKCIDCGN